MWVVKVYKDPYIVCPFYSREESVRAVKIHCEGIKKGTHLHLCFDNKELKKQHKKAHCKNETDYKKCPLYSVISKQFREVGDE